MKMPTSYITHTYKFPKKQRIVQQYTFDIFNIVPTIIKYHNSTRIDWQNVHLLL